MTDKIVSNSFRKTKEIKLPESGVTLEVYSSILIGDLDGISPTENNLDTNLSVLTKVIKSWNFYMNNEDESPLPISVENLKKLPATDFETLISELKNFAIDQKKS